MGLYLVEESQEESDARVGLGLEKMIAMDVSADVSMGTSVQVQERPKEVSQPTPVTPVVSILPESAIQIPQTAVPVAPVNITSPIPKGIEALPVLHQERPTTMRSIPMEEDSEDEEMPTINMD